MQYLRLRAHPETDTTITCKIPRVYVNGDRRRDLMVLSWEMLPAPEFGRVTLTLGAAGATPPRIEDASALPRIGADVRVFCPESETKFRGVVARHRLQVDEDSEHLLADVEHWLTGHLNRTIAGRWHFHQTQSQPIWLESATVQFNMDENTFATQSTMAIGERVGRAFCPATTGQPWSVADALGYLFAACVDENIQTPSLETLDDLASEIELGPTDVTGMTIRSALTQIAREADLVLRPSRTGLTVIFYRPGRQGRRRCVNLQRAGSSLSLARSNLHKGKIEIRRRPGRSALLALGGPKQYEATFELAAGWDPSLQTSRWRDFVRSEADDWPTVADVYRKWVLNEHGRYNQSPWHLPACNLTSISQDDFRLPVARRFLPCLSADPAGQSLGVVVEIKCDSDPWRRWGGAVWVCCAECAVYLEDEQLPADYFNAAVAGTIRLRVTATILSDARLCAEIDGDAGCRRHIADFSNRTAWRKIHSTSIFYNQPGLDTSLEQDDCDRLETLAARRVEAISSAMEARLTLGWIDTSFYPGDILERIDGRAVELSPNPNSQAFVESVRHDFGQAQSTTLLVSG